MIYRLCVDERERLGADRQRAPPARHPRSPGTVGHHPGRPHPEVRPLHGPGLLRTGAGGPGGKRKPGSEPIAVSIPVIVSPELVAAARAQLSRNRAVLVGRRENFSYLLSGLLRCAGCGARYDSTRRYGIPRRSEKQRSATRTAGGLGTSNCNPAWLICGSRSRRFDRMSGGSSSSSSATESSRRSCRASFASSPRAG